MYSRPCDAIAASRDTSSRWVPEPTTAVSWWWLYAIVIGTRTSPCGVLRTWSISRPTIAIVLLAKRLTTSSGIGLDVDVHHTCEYRVVIGPW